MPHTQSPPQGHGIMHFCGLNYRSLKKEKSAGSKREVDDVLHPYTEHRSQTMVDSFSSESGLFWGKGLSLITCCTFLHLSYLTEKFKAFLCFLILYPNLLESLQNLIDIVLHTYLEIISVYPGATHQQKL